MREVVTVLFDNFETLDVFGPIEIMGRFHEHFSPGFYSLSGGVVSSSQTVPVVTAPFTDIKSDAFVLLVPGGFGVAQLLHDINFVSSLNQLARRAAHILSVCTGSILLARTGLLDSRRATSNKRLFTWAQKENPRVEWIKKARWVVDGNIYTSSGVSAGMDMALAFIADQLGYEIAKQQSREIEYEWNEDSDRDIFASLY